MYSFQVSMEIVCADKCIRHSPHHMAFQILDYIQYILSNILQQTFAIKCAIFNCTKLEALDNKKWYVFIFTRNIFSDFNKRY